MIILLNSYRKLGNFSHARNFININLEANIIDFGKFTIGVKIYLSEEAPFGRGALGALTSSLEHGGGTMVAALGGDLGGDDAGGALDERHHAADRAGLLVEALGLGTLAVDDVHGALVGSFVGGQPLLVGAFGLRVGVGLRLVGGPLVLSSLGTEYRGPLSQIGRHPGAVAGELVEIGSLDDRQCCDQVTGKGGPIGGNDLCDPLVRHKEWHALSPSLLGIPLLGEILWVPPTFGLHVYASNPLWILA